MNIDYTIIGIVILLVLVLIFLISKRNSNDKRDFDRQLKDAKKKAERHDKPHI